MSNQNDRPQETLSRRELLKKLGAAGAILGARAIVPANWAKPASEAGLLPVHAQISGVSTVIGEVWLDTRQFRPSTPRVLTAAFTVSVKGSPSLNGNTTTPSNDNGILKYPFSIANVPVGLRTLAAHDNNNATCEGDVESPVTVVLGTTNAGHIDFTVCG